LPERWLSCKMAHNFVRLWPVCPRASIMASDVIQATLAPPKAGLPRFQAVLFRRLLFPLYCRCTSWDKAVAVFRAEGHKSLRAAQRLTPDAFRTRILIRPLWGLEDSSRYWSVEMILEHLIEVGARIATTIVELSHGEKPATDVTEVPPQRRSRAGAAAGLSSLSGRLCRYFGGRRRGSEKRADAPSPVVRPTDRPPLGLSWCPSSGRSSPAVGGDCDRPALSPLKEQAPRR